MSISDDICRRWKLRDVTGLHFRENRRIYGAQSDLYGPVILKWNRDADGLIRECRALTGMGNSGCKVYACENGLLLEERILPGTSLREEKNLITRLEVLASVWENLHLPAQGGESYLNWVENACRIPEIPDRLQNMAGKAEDICRALFRKYPERVLLHGDLHHDNLLLRWDGTYAVIDPKGVAGPRILDLPRFLLNEPESLVWEGMQWLSSRLSYPVADLCKAYYLEAVLANLWFAEDGLPLQEEKLKLAEGILEAAYGSI